MLSRFALLFRMGRLVLALVVIQAIVAAPVITGTAVAFAQDDEDEEEDEDEDEDEEGEEEDEEEEEDGEPQPPVTAGGLYTKKTYPVTELERPLTITQGIFEIRGGIDIDVSAKTAFDTWRAKFDARYGLRDNVELQSAFELLLTGPKASGTREAMLTLGLEASIVYDLLDFRILGLLPFTTNVTDMATGESTTDVTFDLAFGFPFRYKPKPQVAIIALDKLMTIQTGGTDPDLTIGVGIIYQLLPNLAALLRGEVFIENFDTDFIQIPVTAAIQYSPNNKIDFGGEFTLGDVKNDEDPFAKRSLLLFLQTRF